MVEPQRLPVPSERRDRLDGKLSILRRLVTILLYRLQVDRTVVVGFLGVPELKVENDLPIDLLIVPPKGCGGKLDDPLSEELVSNAIPSTCGDVVRLVDDEVRTAIQ